MQIGEFAKICNTRISVLRHYDKEGLLLPDFVDDFTGYRYYSPKQIVIFNKITSLKNAGFSLSEIRRILNSNFNDSEIAVLFDRKKNELLKTISNLEMAKKTMLTKESIMLNITYSEKNNGIVAESESFDANLQNEYRNAMETDIIAKGYQRTSSFSNTCSATTSNEIQLKCNVVKLNDELLPLNENTDIPFVDDPLIVGKWEIVGEYTRKEDFYGNQCKKDYPAKEIYFLPNGQRYWCYNWTKGKLICRFGGGVSSVNEYRTEIIDKEKYMFVDFKSYAYRRGGNPTILVLHQINNFSYSIEEIARKDNINISFVDDKNILGKWITVDLCKSIETFNEANAHNTKLYFNSVEFKPNGEIATVYGKNIFNDNTIQHWTKGYIINEKEHTACEYSIKYIEDNEYLFIQWKSGDYIYGGRDPIYYVFKRA